MKRATIVVTVILLLTLSTARANIFWSDPCGNADYFDWANGQSLYGLFGDPILLGGNTLVFFPSMFRAESIDMQTDSVSDILQFELIAHTGFSFQNISITEYGDYGILGNGMVQASGELSVENTDTTDTLNSSLATNLPSTFPANASGEWQGWTGLDIDSPDWTHIRITLANNLFVISGSDSATWIEKKVLGGAVAVQIIPEPATVATLGIGIIFMLCKSHKRQNKRA